LYYSVAFDRVNRKELVQHHVTTGRAAPVRSATSLLITLSAYLLPAAHSLKIGFR